MMDPSMPKPLFVGIVVGVSVFVFGLGVITGLFRVFSMRRS